MKNSSKTTSIRAKSSVKARGNHTAGLRVKSYVKAGGFTANPWNGNHNASPVTRH